MELTTRETETYCRNLDDRPRRTTEITEINEITEITSRETETYGRNLDDRPRRITEIITKISKLIEINNGNNRNK